MLKQIIFVVLILVLASFVSFAQKSCCTKDKSTYEKSTSTEQIESSTLSEKTHCNVDMIKTSGIDAQNDVETKKELTVFNEVCPVMGKPVDTELIKVEYNGKLYAFCCPGCETKFTSNPEKYIKNLSEDGKTFLGKKRS